MSDTKGNTGHRNTGHWNTGNRNTGNSNIGHCNTGDRNTGHWNTGHWNTGDCNTGNSNTGCFNTTTPEEANFFNKPCRIDVWDGAEKPSFIYKPSLTTWIPMSEMTDNEKKEHPLYETTEGYLRVNDIKEEWEKAYASAREEDKELLLALPNFDADVFFEITGIDVRKGEVEELTIEQICAELGREVKIKK